MEDNKFKKFCVERNIDGKRFVTEPVFATSFDNAKIVLKQSNRKDEKITGIIVNEIQLSEEEYSKIKKIQLLIDWTLDQDIDDLLNDNDNGEE